MARTPLFGFIRRSLRTAQASLHTDVPLDEIMDGAMPLIRASRTFSPHAGRRATWPARPSLPLAPRSGERVAEGRVRGVTRRQFMVAGASAVAAVTIASCTTFPSPSRRDAPVMIIGAGIAGLTAGYRLQRAGIDVRIFDGQNRTGGRMLSLRGFFPDGQVAEMGGELIDTGHTHIRALAGELGIELNDLSKDDAPERDIWFFDGVKRSEREVVEAFRPIAALMEADAARIEATAADLDRMTIAQWLDNAGAAGWFREMLDVGFTTEFGLEIDRQSALNLLTMIDPNPEPFRMYGESDERFHVKGGNDRIPTALASALGERIELNSTLQRIRRRADGLIECTFARGATTFVTAAPHVIVAIPFTMLRSVTIDIDLPERKRRAIRELGYGTNAKLMVGFAQRLWRTKYRSNGSTLSDQGYQLTWETSRLQTGESGILTNFTGGRHGIELGEGSPAERAADLARQLELIYPGISALRGREARMHWPTNAFVRASYASYLPGQWTTIRGVEGEAVGNLHFAGEHCSLDAQGFMEGGCETGERAAAEVLASVVGRDARPLRARRPLSTILRPAVGS